MAAFRGVYSIEIDNLSESLMEINQELAASLLYFFSRSIEWSVDVTH
ncbi:hypothetical protein OK016_04845 [Vibrio chagasii]|nr:hypothetical protein [Vibrio chagasii]